MTLNNKTIIVADDLTGANDSALQYFKSGNKTKIIFDFNDFSLIDDADVVAISTETRNLDSKDALDTILELCKKLENVFNFDIYKKIDSTLRGNAGLEIATILLESGKDAAIVAPAYIEEERTTIGGYQLLSGTIIERCQCALDPKSPITESYIPDILKRNISENIYDKIATINMNTVTKGAGPIILKIKELIEKGKKIIVVDAASKTDLDQIALSISKCGYNIIPCGSAGLASSINKKDVEIQKKLKTIPDIARLVISGSATNLTKSQIQKLKESARNIFYVDLKAQDIISGIDDNLKNEIIEKLNSKTDVVIHSSDIKNSMDNEDVSNILINEGIAKSEFSNKITDFLSDLTSDLSKSCDFILISIGGETSFKCAKKMESKYLEIIDAITESIPLCLDSKGRIFVTKSGNFGNFNTLVDILNYFDKLR